jgi:hypothetical protein
MRRFSVHGSRLLQLTNITVLCLVLFLMSKWSRDSGAAFVVPMFVLLVSMTVVLLLQTLILVKIFLVDYLYYGLTRRYEFFCEDPAKFRSVPCDMFSSSYTPRPCTHVSMRSPDDDHERIQGVVLEDCAVDMIPEGGDTPPFYLEHYSQDEDKDDHETHTDETTIEEKETVFIRECEAEAHRIPTQEEDYDDSQRRIANAARVLQEISEMEADESTGSATECTPESPPQSGCAHKDENTDRFIDASFVDDNIEEHFVCTSDED